MEDELLLQRTALDRGGERALGGPLLEDVLFQLAQVGLLLDRRKGALDEHRAKPCCPPSTRSADEGEARARWNPGPARARSAILTSSD